MTMSPTIAFLGLGLMGEPMATHLINVSFHINLWNRSPEKLAPFRSMDCHCMANAADAVDNADIIISILSDGPAVMDVMKCSSPKSGALWIDMSSTRPSEAREMVALLSDRGVYFLDAPVSGGTKGAQTASLAIMVGGDRAHFDHAKPILEHLGRPVHVGGAGSGQLAKLANQAIVAITIGAVAEATLLLERGGADAGAVRDALKNGFADSTILQQHGTRMSKRDFEPGGLSRLQLKDLDNVLSEASECGVTLPTVSHIRDRFFDYVHEMGAGERDHSGLFEELLQRQDS